MNQPPDFADMNAEEMLHEANLYAEVEVNEQLWRTFSSDVIGWAQMYAETDIAEFVRLVAERAIQLTRLRDQTLRRLEQRFRLICCDCGPKQ